MNKRATCHCGNITIEVNQAPDIVTDCHCSICRRYAALWAYYAPDEVVISHREQASQFYIWGDRDIEFHHCTLCHCITHYQTTEQCDVDVVAVNARMFNDLPIDSIPVRKIARSEN